MNYASLTVEELGSLAMNDAGAREYIADNAEELLTAGERRVEAYSEEISGEAYEDGMDEGSRSARQELLNDFETRLETAAGDLLDGKGDPDKLGRKKKKLWELVTEILTALDR